MCGSRMSERNALCPGDLMSLARRPLMLVMEGEGSGAFASFVSPFGTACVALLSPAKYPAGCERQRHVVSPTFGGSDEGTEPEVVVAVCLRSVM